MVVPALCLLSAASLPKCTFLYLGKGGRRRWCIFTRQYLSSPREKNTSETAPSPQPCRHGRGSSVLAPHFPVRKSLGFFTERGVPGPILKRSHPVPYVRTGDRTGREQPGLCLFSRLEMKRNSARCFLIFSFPFPGLGGIPLPARTF